MLLPLYAIFLIYLLKYLTWLIRCGRRVVRAPNSRVNGWCFNIWPSQIKDIQK